MVEQLVGENEVDYHSSAQNIIMSFAFLIISFEWYSISTKACLISNGQLTLKANEMALNIFLETFKLNFNTYLNFIIICPFYQQMMKSRLARKEIMVLT